MYIKLKREEKTRYHFCREHLEEMGELDALDQPGKLSDDTFNTPEKLCEQCKDLAERGDCHAVYVVTGSFTN